MIFFKLKKIQKNHQPCYYYYLPNSGKRNICLGGQWHLRHMWCSGLHYKNCVSDYTVGIVKDTITRDNHRKYIAEQFPLNNIYKNLSFIVKERFEPRKSILHCLEALRFLNTNKYSKCVSVFSYTKMLTLYCSTHIITKMKK